jgi:hypothetical protein
MAYNLIHILEADPTKETYTIAEIKKLIDAYVMTSDQK